MNRIACVCSLVGFGLLQPAVAQPLLSRSEPSRPRPAYLDTSSEATNYLRTAEAYLANENWNQAFELIERVVDEFGEKIIPPDSPEPVARAGNIANYCHNLVSRLPGAALKDYRRRVDARAELLFREALDRADWTLMDQVVERYFTSSWADDALDLLGEVYFERGEFEAALRQWSRIRTELDDSDSPRLLYPDSDLDLAAVTAKRILCLAHAARNRAAGRMLAQFRATYPKPPSPQVALILENAESKLSREQITGFDLDWPTFGGNSQRSRNYPYPVHVGSVQWKATLPNQYSRRPTLALQIESRATSNWLSFHPIIVGKWLMVCGWDRVVAYDLHRGPKENEPAWEYLLYRDKAQLPVMPRSPVGAPHYTSSSDGERIYVRLGPPVTSLARRGGIRRLQSFLVCLRVDDGEEIFRLAPDSEGALAFDGSPLVSGGNLYVALRGGNTMIRSMVACYDANSGKKKWQRLVCESSLHYGGGFQGTVSHNLVSYGAGLVFLNTNLGACAALEAETGKTRWIVTYDRRPVRRGADGIVRPPLSINPCVYQDGRVFLRPEDSDSLVAIDAFTGHILWHIAAEPIQDLLGVSADKLICCTDHAVVGLDVESGRVATRWEGGPGLWSFGRGLIGADQVYFPTKTTRGGEIYVLNGADLRQTQPPIQLTEAYSQLPGNLVAGNGYLVVAHTRGLTVLSEDSLQMQRYQKWAERDPGRAEPYFRMARCAQRLGDIPVAKANYQKAIELARPADQIEGTPLRQLASTQMVSLLLSEAASASEFNDWPRAIDSCRQAESFVIGPQQRVRWGMQLAEVYNAAERHRQALEVYHTLLGDETLRGVLIPSSKDRQVRLDLELASRIESIVRDRGSELYAGMDQRALELFARARSDGDQHKVERLLRNYPATTIRPRIHRFLAEKAREIGDTDLAIYHLNSVGGHGQPVEDRIALRKEMAELLEQAARWSDARKVWLSLAEEHGDRPAGTSENYREFVERKLQQGPLAQQTPTLNLLERKWDRVWSGPNRLILFDAPQQPRPVFLAVMGNRLECVDGASGKTLWQLTIARPVVWAGADQSTVFLLFSDRILAVQKRSGAMSWESSLKMRSAFPELSRGRSGSRSFKEALRLGTRIYLVESPRTVHCLESRTGERLWSHTTRSEKLIAGIQAAPGRVVLRGEQPGVLLVLDADGLKRMEVSADGWPQTPLVIDGDRLCVVDRQRSLRMLDLNKGSWLWIYESGKRNSVQPISADGKLLALMDGRDLVRLDVSTGEKLWSKTLSARSLSNAAANWAVDDRYFYCVTHSNRLQAIGIEDSSVHWQHVLSGSAHQWNVQARRGYVMAFPTRPSPDRILPFLVCRRDDGAPIQRMLFQTTGNSAILHWSSSLALVGSQRGIWGIGEVQ